MRHLKIPDHHHHHRHHQLKLAVIVLLCIVASLLKTQSSLGVVSAEITSPSATISSSSSSASSLSSASASSSSSSLVTATSSEQPLILPKINIYASRSEVKKLLGIDTTINYITNGQLNTYPLGFSIPMGYHLSDMIFTWQNLGPTNVNYSISLVIGNIQAVERPLINITRSGLIPRQEQVFKITLPCSGTITDDVDVQVLINIVGLVPVTTSPQQPNRLKEPVDSMYGSSMVDDGDMSSNGATEAQPSATDYQLARAVQEQNELLAAAAQQSAAANSHGQTNSSMGDQMQADQQQSTGDTGSTSAGGSVSGASAGASSGASAAADIVLGQPGAKRAPPVQPQMRQVSHTLAIKRKKICTMHPVPVQPAPRQPDIRPPNQPPHTGSMLPSPDNTLPANGVHAATPTKWPSALPDQQPTTPQTGGNGYTPVAGQHQQPPQQPPQQPKMPVAEPEHQPIWSMTEPPSTTASIGQNLPTQPRGGETGSLLAKFRSQPPSTGGISSRPSVSQSQDGVGQTHNNHNQWPTQTLRAPIQPSPQLPTPQDYEQNPLSAILHPQPPQEQTGTGNPLLFTLIVMSLIISVALIALLILGSASSTASRYSRAGPLDKLTALTNCIWRRTSAGSRAVNKCTKNHVAPITIKNGIIGTFASANNSTTVGRMMTGGQMERHNGLKSTVGSLSGLSTISGLNNNNGNNINKQHQHHHQNQNHLNSLMSPYCQKQQQHAGYNTGYYHHYQLPPDLLIGTTGAAAAAGLQTNTTTTTTTTNALNSVHQSPITSPYQINMNHNRMTKLFLANPANNGTYSIDNNYMPITTTNTLSTSSISNGCQAPHSDSSGSVYQTIY